MCSFLCNAFLSSYQWCIWWFYNPDLILCVSNYLIVILIKHCSGCREKTLFSNGFLLILNFQNFSKLFPSPLHQIFHWNIKNMTEELHSIKNCIKWKHEPNYDRELSKCNFLQSQTSTPVERFCKSGWHKLHQQYMPALNTNRNIQTVLLGDSLIQGLSRYKKVWNSFFGKDTLSCGIRGDKVENLIWRAEKLEFPPAIRQILIHCGTNNIEENTPNDIGNGLLCSALIIKKRNSVTNIYITGLLPRHFRETHKRNKIKKVNKLIREKCSSISTPRINYIEQDHDWIDEGNCLRTKYYYRDCLHLVEIGNKKLSNTTIKAIKHSNLTMSVNTSKYKATTVLTGEDFPPLSRLSTEMLNPKFLSISPPHEHTLFWNCSPDTR